MGAVVDAKEFLNDIPISLRPYAYYSIYKKENSGNKENNFLAEIAPNVFSNYILPHLQPKDVLALTASCSTNFEIYNTDVQRNGPITIKVTNLDFSTLTKILYSIA